MTSETIVSFPSVQSVAASEEQEEGSDEDGVGLGECKTLTSAQVLTQLRKEARAYLTADAYTKFEDDLAEQTLAICIGTALLQYRIRTRSSIAAIALKSGMSKAAAYDLEAGEGKRGPRISSVQKYLRGLDASLVLVATRPEKTPRHITITADASPESVSSQIVEMLRDMARMSQAQVERRLNSPGGLLSRIEKQRQGAVTLGMIAKVARACDVTLTGVEVIGMKGNTT